MKKLYLFTIALLGSYSAYSQTILDKTETVSRTVSDPQSVIMLPGFHAKAETVSPFIAKIAASTDGSGGGPTDSPIGSSNPSGTVPGSSNFHDTQGNIEVNGGGQLQYTLPIALPPGIKSVAPQMNLVYTSGSGNGIAGYGWSLSGITSISRMGRTIEKDGEVKGIQLDYTDYYSFNGQRLILKSGEYGKNGAEYVTEKYSNVKIKSIGSISGQVWQGPEYWEVTFEDGSQAWYGSSGNAKTPIEYNIVKWKDAQGNYITYDYTQESGSNVAVISSVSWGGNEALSKTHFNKINFNYDNRDLKESSYVNGISFLQSKLLTNIEVIGNNAPFKKYIISYKKDNNGTNYQLVDNVQEFNSANEPANPVVFNYEQSISGGWKDVYNNTDNETYKVHGDFDGDGKIDLLKYSNAENYCAEYESVRYKQNIQSIAPETGETLCKTWVNNPAGIYLYSGVFENNTYAAPKKIFVSSEITKESLKDALPITLKGNDKIVKNRQGLAFLVRNGIGSNIEIRVYALNDTGTNGEKTLTYEFSRIVLNTDFDRTTAPASSTNNWNSITTNVSKTLREIDVDANGLSEIVLTLDDTISEPEPSPDNPQMGQTIPNLNYTTTYRYLVVDMDTDTPYLKSFSTHTLYPNNIDVFEKYIVGDFNGNGKTDFLRYDSSNRPFLMEFVKNNELLYPYEYSYYKNDEKIQGIKESAITGDFNGDGKTDLMVPYAEGSSDWNLYLSTGKNFIQKNYSNFSLFKKKEGDDYEQLVRSYYAQDLNKDGKSDFLVFHSQTSVNQNTAQFYIEYFENKGLDANASIGFEKKHILGDGTYTTINISGTLTGYKFQPFIKNYVETRDPNSNYPSYSSSYSLLNLPAFTKINKAGHFSPVFGNFRINTTNENILVFHQNKLIKFSNYDFSKTTRIASITQGGITTEVEYKELEPAINSGFYAPVKKEVYPLMEMDKVSQSYAVSQLRQPAFAGATNSLKRKQDFKYRGFMAHLQGKGMIGFRQSARSSWYTEGFENTKIWSGAEIDPKNNGVPIREWSVKVDNDDAIIFPTNFTATNAQLISLKQSDYKTDFLNDGVVIGSVVNDGVLPAFTDAQKQKLVTALVPIATTQWDFLKKIKSTNDVTYGQYYLPVKTTGKIFDEISGASDLAATSTTDLSYIHNPSGVGKDYYIGRPAWKKESITAYGDTKGAKEEYTYINNQLQTKKTYDRIEKDWISETYSYDDFGNIVQKKIENSEKHTPQVHKSDYDPMGRFVIKKTDPQKLETFISYNNWGQVLTQQDPLGNTLTNDYDAWGKLTKSKTNLGGHTTYTYYKNPSSKETVVTQYDPTGDVKITYTNALGQQYKSATKGFAAGSYVEKVVEFDAIGRKTGESEPYDVGDTPKMNIIDYNKDLTFPTTVTAIAFNGKKLKTYVDKRTTYIEEENGYRRITSKTTDALGNVISSTDKGGTIAFEYNAAGENTRATYAGNVVVSEYDNWGRKTKFHDPSNGLYQYEYKGYFGAISQELSPKGYKQYEYNDKGQLFNIIEKSYTAGLTDKNISIAYNNKGMVTQKTGTANGQAYSSYINYDAYGRVISSGENSNGKHFMKKAITYDGTGRVVSYEKGLYSSGVYTKTIIENVYSTWGGDLYQVKEKTSGKVLWELQEQNAKGLVKKAKLGITNITNDYDANYFLTNVNHSNDKGTVLQMSYQFDAIKNELKSRTRGGDFSIIELFDYDDNNRLVNWSDPTTNTKPILARNKYDDQGRIIENDQVGTIKFQNTKLVYRASSIELNAAGQQNYLNDLTQKIIYNENNDPLYINGVKGDVRFTYGLTKMRQMATYGGEFTKTGEGKFTKYYSEDGSYEIIKNNQTGQEKHILYIGGSPYESDIVYLKDFSEAQASYKFLHKDYLGSILAISDEAGNKLEQRHFDAWGQFTHLKVGASATIVGVKQVREYLANNQLIIDRGYTSHEHFSEVGIIHMNGRLYDPLLRRFLNADENIQDPHNTQVYNKYGYVMNNPLMYNDPSGEFAFLVPLLTFLAKNIVAIAIGAYVGFGTYFLGVSLSGQKPTFLGALKAVFFGAVSGAVTAGIGDIFKMGDVVKALGDGLVLAQGAAHGISQGVLSVFQGGDFITGAASGFLGSLGASGWQSAAGKFANSALGTIAFGALSGGIGAELTGGNFWQGAITGGIVAGLNHLGHINSGEDPRNPNRKIKNLNYKSKSILKEATSLSVITSSLDGPLVIGEAVGVGILTGSVLYDETQKTHITYTLTNKTGQIYVGRTSGFGSPYGIMMQRFSSHHMRLLGFSNPMLDQVDIGIAGRMAIRGREQQVIDYYGGVGSNRVANAIRGVSKYNPLGSYYHELSNIRFGNLSKYTGF